MTDNARENGNLVQVRHPSGYAGDDIADLVIEDLRKYG